MLFTAGGVFITTFPNNNLEMEIQKIQDYSLVTAFSATIGTISGLIAKIISSRHYEDAQSFFTKTPKQKNVATFAFAVSVLGWSTSKLFILI
jgi:hypothetical protein